MYFYDMGKWYYDMLIWLTRMLKTYNIPVLSSILDKTGIIITGFTNSCLSNNIVMVNYIIQYISAIILI